MRRTAKQIFYGAAFLIFLGVVFGGGYFLFFSAPPSCFDNKLNQAEADVDCGGPCAISCEIKQALPLEIISISVPKFFDNSAVIAEIKNPNLNAGATFEYNIKLISADGSRSKEVYGDSFIYAGEIKRIIEVLPVSESFSQKEITFANLNWKTSNDFKKSSIQLLSQKTELENQAAEIISGTLGRNLSLNDQGEDVRLLQNFLFYTKFYTEEITGRFGSGTKKALIAYQKARKISPAGGTLDVKTRQAINSEISNIKNSLPSDNISPVSVSGVIQNDGVLSLSKIVINAFIYNKSGGLAGASKTEFENLGVGDTREFRISFSPQTPTESINPGATKIDIYAI